MYEMLGEFEAARGDYEQAIEAARTLQAVGAEAQGLLDLGFLWTAHNYEKAGECYRQAAPINVLYLALKSECLWRKVCSKSLAILKLLVLVAY